MATVPTAWDLNRFFALSNDLLGVANGKGYFVELSASWERTLGLTRAEMLSAPFLDFVHPADRDATIFQTSALAAGAQTICFENRYRCRDGNYRWLDWCVTPSCDDGHLYFVARDVTERKQLERAQSDHEQKLREVMGESTHRSPRMFEVESELLRVLQENLPVCVWVIDRHGVFMHHAGRGLSSVGHRQGEYVGHNIFDLYRQSETIQETRRALAGEFMHSITEAHGAAWETWQIPITNARGEVTSVAGITLDVSRAKRAERELQAKLELIQIQQRTIHALTVPIIEVWDEVLTVPMIGVVDSSRAAEVMENLLSRVVEQRARFVILDLTGVEALDTATASHLIKITQALRLLGAQGIITGIQPNVAQTLITLGVDLRGVLILANLRDGLRHCMRAPRGAAM